MSFSSDQWAVILGSSSATQDMDLTIFDEAFFSAAGGIELIAIGLVSASELSRVASSASSADVKAFESTTVMLSEPNFSSVWINQAHNVSFNISVQFDDYRDRYHYILKGLQLLKKGLRYNQKNPKMVNDLAFFINTKIIQHFIDCINA